MSTPRCHRLTHPRPGAAAAPVLGLALALTLAGCLQPPSDPLTRTFGPVVFETESEFSHLRVRSKGSVRSLLFVGDDGYEVRQSAVDLERPGRLVIPYTRDAFASLLVRPDQGRVLVVGLGGGGMVRFLNERLPGTRVDAIEIDPAVVDAARDYFGVTPNNTTNIVTADAFEFFDSPPAQLYDVIYMDAFLIPDATTGASGIPTKLKAVQFLTSLHRHLQPGGAVSFNLIENPQTPHHLASIDGAFPTVYTLDVAQTNNLIAIASLAPAATPGQIGENARHLDRTGDLGFKLAPLAEQLRRR